MQRCQGRTKSIVPSRRPSAGQYPPLSQLRSVQPGEIGEIVQALVNV
jgi:hypothetical protein